MNLDKYWTTNCGYFDWVITPRDKIIYKKYLKYITSLSRNSKVLEVGPWSWSFLLFFKNTFHLSDKNISTTDISKSVFDWLSKNPITKNFNNNYWDTIELLKKSQVKYDLIIMKHVLEHMTKEYISELIPLLVDSLNVWWQILVEVPNIMNYPFGYYMYWGDFSHYTAFNDKSLREVFLWHAKKIDIHMYNLFLYIIDYKNPLRFIITLLQKILYAIYIYWWLLLLKLTGLPIKVFTASLLCVIKKK